MTDTNRWGLLSEEERLEVLDMPFGWMLRNILQYGNKELDVCYDKLYKCFCEGKFCTECNLSVPYDGCVLCILQDSIEILKEKSDELL